MRHDQRRFVTTGTVRDASGKPITIKGHLIGPGHRGVDSIQRKLVVEMFGQLTRTAKGRFAWALSRLEDKMAEPNPLTRQRRRAQERTAAKAADSLNRKQPKPHPTGLSRHYRRAQVAQAA